MKKLSQFYVGALLFFIFFPYIKILPLASYTQPYSYLLALVLFRARYLKYFPKKEAICLMIFTVSGLLIYFATAYPYIQVQEIKYLLIYVSPILFSVVGFYLMARHRNLMRLAVEVSIVVWFLVGTIQLFVSSNFLTSLITFNTEMGDRMLSSGRGVIGLAPEPTHYGLHMLVLVCIYALIGNRKYPFVLALVTVVLIAKSTTAVLVLLCTAAVWTVIHFKSKFLKIFGSLIATMLVISLLGETLFQDTRIFRIFELFGLYGFSLLEIDHSASARIGGMILAYKTSFMDLLIPHGMSHAMWLDNSRGIISRNIWLLNLSQVGFPSGFGIVLYQIGFFGLSLFAFFILVLSKISRINSLKSFAVIAIFLIFNSQFYISAATFGLFVGVILFQLRNRDGERETVLSVLSEGYKKAI